MSDVPTSGTKGERPAVAVLDRESSIPLYVQLSDVIRAKIERREWVPQQKIPSENELNRMYGISRMTARGVLARLVDDGLLFRVQGKGTFVAPEKISAQSPWYMGLRGQLEQDGHAASTRLLGAAVREADSHTAEMLEIQTGARVFTVRRLRSIDGQPLSLQETNVPESLAPGLLDRDLESEHVVTVLNEHYGLRMAHMFEALEVSAATKEQAKLLDCQQGFPLLVLEQRIASPVQVRFDFTRVHFRSDLTRIEFRYDL